jgi:aspartate kinase
MGQTTDELVSLAGEITAHPSRREMDMLLTAGERITMALLSMALQERSVSAISFTGSQSGIITDSRHSRARVLEIRPIRIGPELERGKVVIVAGFQGVSREKEVTTLGRGGSDTTAVALAVGLGADACEIYTDVPGVMTADPRHVPGGRLLPRVSWDTMLEMACTGAAVMHSRAIQVARSHRIPFRVRSSYEEGEGTSVEGSIIERDARVTAVTGRPRTAVVALSGLRPEAAGAELFETLDGLLEDLAALDLVPEGETVSLRFHIPVLPEGEDLLDRLGELATRYGGTLRADLDHASVTVVGTGILDAARVSARGCRALARRGILPRGLLTGNLSVTFLVPPDGYEEALRELHSEFLEA